MSCVMSQETRYTLLCCFRGLNSSPSTSPSTHYTLRTAAAENRGPSKREAQQRQRVTGEKGKEGIGGRVWQKHSDHLDTRKPNSGTMFGCWITSFLFLLATSEFFVVVLSENNTGGTAQKNAHEMDFTRHNILTAQFECFQKIMKDTNHNRTDGSMCKRTWDGWLCWDDLEAGVTSAQHCPDYYTDFDTSEMATKICTDTGHWFVHPESNRTWTNYTGCTHMTNDQKKTALNLYYLALIGHALSLISLFTSLGIFFYFKSLSCQRITLHKNLFFSFVLNSVITIIFFTCVANNQEVTQANPVSVQKEQRTLTSCMI
ncbi:hypothetical protein H4Q32_011843 [Labeo rohita]|uniref:Calcitonin gene-related peptide type 1 receptor n=1 Tax=Labeo rohita TaxID=84645 RepID=A0ABQ8MKE8_LABRO|nr:hypothetical protein H4Q32_011843 [Labeo rohita]